MHSANDVTEQSTQAYVNDFERALPKHYRLIEMIGRGGMAEVYLAQDERLGRRVAIKFLSAEFRRDQDRMRRFKQEARSASALNHPNILTIHDIGEAEGVQYIVSEYVEGITLSSRITLGTVPLAEAADIAIQIASALSASHRAGIVHRDLKPDNVMIRRDGQVKVLDFGLAKETGELMSRSGDHDASTLDRISTSPGLVMGTPQYMSPEQARGRPLDARTDIFSLGIILFEMVTGRTPFGGNSMTDLIVSIVSKEPKRLEEYLSDPPLSLIRIVQKVLRKDREQRYSSMDHLLSDLKDLQRELADDPLSFNDTADNERRTTINNTLHAPAARRQVLFYLGVALAAVLFIAGAWWYAAPSPPSNVSAPGTMRTIPIVSWSSGTGEISSAASFSPDARIIAFAANKTGSTEIWVQPVTGGDSVQVTKNGHFNLYPIWSPNGQEIAFFSNRGGSLGIWRAAFMGGREVQMASVSRMAKPIRWASDGNLYLKEGPDIFAVDERTGTRKQLTNFAAQGLRPQAIALSPDASSLAYSIKDGDLWKLKRGPADGTAAEEIATSNYQIDYIAWNPDGDSVFYSGSVDGHYQVFKVPSGAKSSMQLSNGSQDHYVLDVSAKAAEILYGSIAETSDLWRVKTDNGEVSVVANEVDSEFWPDVSPDGKGVAYQSIAQAERPYSGSVMATDTDGKAYVVSRQGFAPAWSPDGKSIAFLKRTESDVELWQAGSRGDSAIKISGENVAVPGYITSPYIRLGTNSFSWSPDSGRLAFTSSSGGASNLWIAPSNGSPGKKLTDNSDMAKHFNYPLWTPDGNRIILTISFTGRPDAGSRIDLFDIGSVGSRTVFESTLDLRVLGTSASGDEIVIAQKAPAGNDLGSPAAIQVLSVSLSSGSASRVNSLPGAVLHNIHLSCDGQSVAYAAIQDGRYTLNSIPLQGGTPKELLTEKDPKFMISSLAYSPDGKEIIFGKQTRSHLLSMLSK